MKWTPSTEIKEMRITFWMSVCQEVSLVWGHVLPVSPAGGFSNNDPLLFSAVSAWLCDDGVKQRRRTHELKVRFCGMLLLAFLSFPSILFLQINLFCLFSLFFFFYPKSQFWNYFSFLFFLLFFSSFLFAPAFSKHPIPQNFIGKSKHASKLEIHSFLSLFFFFFYKATHEENTSTSFK